MGGMHLNARYTFHAKTTFHLCEEKVAKKANGLFIAQGRDALMFLLESCKLVIRLEMLRHNDARTIISGSSQTLRELAFTRGDAPATVRSNKSLVPVAQVLRISA